MKKLSDYKGAEAIELWADLIDPLSDILADKNVAKTVKSGKPKMIIAKEIIKAHKDNAVKILLRIDDTPIDGFNLILRLATLLAEIGENEEAKSFFGYAEQAKEKDASSGFVMGSTEVAEN